MQAGSKGELYSGKKAVSVTINSSPSPIQKTSLKRLVLELKHCFLCVVWQNKLVTAWYALAVFFIGKYVTRTTLTMDRLCTSNR